MLTPQDLSELRRQRLWSRLAAYPLYALVVLFGRVVYGYTFKDLRNFRNELWSKLEKTDGPVIWAANHLTLIDSFLIVWAVFPLRKVHRSRFVPWSTPEYRNYYHLGGWLLLRTIRLVMYLSRCIPFLREGEDEASARWREKVFEKLVGLLKDGEAAFVYPEAARSRSGWFEERRPKDFLGRLALEVPNASFLCVYLRGERQAYATAVPRHGEVFRMRAELIPAVLPGETTPRAVSQRLFHAIAELQRKWWAESGLPRNCGGNDVVDLKSPRLRENFDLETGEADPEWLERHLTAKERAYLEAQPREKAFVTFWKFFAAKEAAHKALAQSGIAVPSGGYLLLEADLFRRTVVHRPSHVRLDIAFTDEDADKVHCVAVLRGGYIGDDQIPGDVVWAVDEAPPGRSPSEFARERCLELIAESSDDIPSPDVLAFTEEDGIPRVLRRGKFCDWGVSISHSGRFAACSFMVS